MVRFVDTSLSGSASAHVRGVLAGRVTLPFLKRMDAMGFHAIDILDPEIHRISLTTLGEDPYDRLARAARLCTRTPLNVVAGGRCLFTDEPADDGALDATMRRLQSCGARSLMCLDPLGDVAVSTAVLKAARAAGMTTVGGLVFAVSPFHTTPYYVAAARAAVSADASHICLVDPAGLLDPDRARALVPALRQAIGDLPLEIRTACRSGLAEKTCFDAIDLGADLIATAAAPLAGGGMAPPADHLAASLVRSGRLQAPSLGDLAAMSSYFGAMCEALGVAAEPHELPDPLGDTHQLPASLCDELRVEAAARHIAHRMPKLIAEMAAVRGELGSVSAMYGLGRAMVRQAVEHIATGRRHACLEPLLARCLRGELGRAPGMADSGLVEHATHGAHPSSSPLETGAALVGMPNPIISGDLTDASTPLSQLADEIARRPWVRAVTVRKGAYEWSFPAHAGCSAEKPDA